MIKFELHAHTSECDPYARLSGKELVRCLYDKGYSGTVITDHYFRYFSEWFGSELSGASERDVIKRRLAGFYAAKEEGEKLGFTVLPGAEVRFDGQENDYLLYGAEEEFFYRNPDINKLSGVEELKSILPENILVVQAHPFRNKMTVCDPGKLFGIEVYNAGTEEYRNKMAYDFAAHYGKPFTSGSDIHGKETVGKGGIVTEKSITCPRKLAEVLVSGEYKLILDGKNEE